MLPVSCSTYRVPRNLRIDIKDRLEEYSQSIELGALVAVVRPSRYINMIVHIFINLTFLLHRMGWLAPICWSEYSTCLPNMLYSRWLKKFFLVGRGVGTA